MTLTQGDVWRNASGRRVRILAVYPSVVRYAYVINGQLTATTYTDATEQFMQRFRPATANGNSPLARSRRAEAQARTRRRCDVCGAWPDVQGRCRVCENGR